MTTDSLCPRCNEHLEMHVWMDCDEVRAFWMRTVHDEDLSKFFSLGLHAWVDRNLSNGIIENSDEVLHGNEDIFVRVIEGL